MDEADEADIRRGDGSRLTQAHLAEIVAQARADAEEMQRPLTFQLTYRADRLLRLSAPADRGRARCSRHLQKRAARGGHGGA